MLERSFARCAPPRSNRWASAATAATLAGSRHTAGATDHPAIPEVLPPSGQPRRAHTVYECPSCDGRSLGEQRCDDCGTFMRSIGLGGLSPRCGEIVTVDELLGQ